MTMLKLKVLAFLLIPRGPLGGYIYIYIVVLVDALHVSQGFETTGYPLVVTNIAIENHYV